MLRLLAVVTAAAARPDNTTYFDAAETLWPFFLSYDLAARYPQAHSIAFARFLGVSKVGFFRRGDNATDCLARVKPWLARLRAYAASDARPSDGGFDGVARACTDGDDRSCAAAWRRRAEKGAAALARKYPTVVPRLLATCA